MTKTLKMSSARTHSASIRRIYRLAYRRVEEITKFAPTFNPVGFRKTPDL